METILPTAPGLTLVGCRRQQEAAAAHRVTQTFTLCLQLCAHQVQVPLLPFFIMRFSLGFVFFHAHTRASTHAAAALEYPVCVIFIKTLPSTLHTKCSGNSGSRTRGFGFLSALTPGVEAPRLNQIPGWDYDLKINQSSCPS